MRFVISKRDKKLIGTRDYITQACDPNDSFAYSFSVAVRYLRYCPTLKIKKIYLLLLLHTGNNKASLKKIGFQAQAHHSI
jgi:hypothetical protein